MNCYPVAGVNTYVSPAEKAHDAPVDFCAAGTVTPCTRPYMHDASSAFQPAAAACNRDRRIP